MSSDIDIRLLPHLVDNPGIRTNVRKLPRKSLQSDATPPERETAAAPSDREAGERGRAEQTLRAHEAGLRRAQQMGKLAHVITGPAGEFLAWSETLPAMIGRDAASMPATTRAWLEFVHPEDRELFRRTAIQAARTGRRAKHEYRLLRSPSEWIHIREVMEPVGAEPDASVGRRWVSTLQDISAEKHAARALRASEEQYRATFEQAAVAIVHSSLEGELRLVNEAFCAMTGFSRAEAVQLDIRDITHPEDIGASTAGRTNIIKGSGPYQREFRLRRKDGSHLWATVSTSLVRAADGSPQHFVSVLSDISERKRAEEEVNRFRAAMDSTVDAIFLSDPKTMRFLYVNQSACRSLGYKRERLLQTPPWELLGKTREQLRVEQEEVIAAGEKGKRTETRYVRSDGSGGWTELYRRALVSGGSLLIVTIARDITERKTQQQKIERLSRVHAVLSGINAAIVRIRDRAELFHETCRIAYEAGGFDAVWVGVTDSQRTSLEPVAWQGQDERIQRLQRDRFDLRGGDEDDTNLLAEMMQTRKPVITNDAPNDPRVRSKDALAQAGINAAAFLPLIVAEQVIGVMALYSPVKGRFDADEVKLLSELAADISFALEHLEKAERAAYLALYDELTGLANQRLLAERLGQFMHTAGHAQGKLAIALLDIERLRSINKSLGRRGGDALLRQVAERLSKAVGAGAIARTAADNFAVVLPTVKERGEAGRLVTALARTCFAAPYVVEGTELRVGVKAGLALFPSDGLDAETLLANAEAALRKAKASGERQVFYTPNLAERTGGWLPIESKLGGALERDEFVLHYQPKVDTATRSIIGLEALIRWQSPDFGLVPPMKFIPLMEETGMILEVGAWALRRAACDQRRWTELGLRPLRVAVNVSPIQLRQRDFVQAVEQAIRQGVTPTAIDLEITESLVMEDVEENIRKLNEVRALGVQVAIDDFGTGYSSLGYLAKLPVQALKIDRSFINAMLTDSAALTLVQTITSLAHTLGLKVIAEGVEKEEHAKYLRLLRCDQIQGYLVSKPLPFDEMTRFLSPSPVCTQQPKA
jgi:PAS domain S-box-containing protein/diguanylate cyclase (GGDEF)-like protein